MVLVDGPNVAQRDHFVVQREELLEELRAGELRHPLEHPGPVVEQGDLGVPEEPPALRDQRAVAAAANRPQVGVRVRGAAEIEELAEEGGAVGGASEGAEHPGRHLRTLVNEEEDAALRLPRPDLLGQELQRGVAVLVQGVLPVGLEAELDEGLEVLQVGQDRKANVQIRLRKA